MIAAIRRWLESRAARRVELRERCKEAVLTILDDQEMSGRDLREKLHMWGHDFGLVPFFAFMAKLEDEGHIESWDEPREIDGVEIKTRMYRKRKD